MEQPSSLDIRQFQGIRRWPRYEIDLPVRILALNGVLTTPIRGHGHEISRGGMALEASVPIGPGDILRLQFPTSEPSRVVAIVRNRVGERLGLEFLSQLPPDDVTKEQTKYLSGTVLGNAPESAKLGPKACSPNTLYAGLRRKREEHQRIRKEIEALRLAIVLLADDEKDVRAMMPPRMPMDVRPWPPQA